MFAKIYEKSNHYFSKHVMLNSIAHAAAGFGLALVLQDYLQGTVFLASWVGWLLILFSVAIHVRSMMK